MDISVDKLIDELSTDLESLLSTKGITNPGIIGIQTGGVWVAQRLHQKLQSSLPMGALNISFYRDDFTQVGLHPRVTPSELPFEVEGQHIVLVDDVIMSGRTIRAALNELFDYGRPASVTLVVLISLDGRELPVQPDLYGLALELEEGTRIKLDGPQPLKLVSKQAT
ncbi:MAG: bifunctional pyr operon transcriptional regulator/uracil phosphoribosyltransferase PyrR [Pseudomonadales bacterium]|nr:bifunctional pyr operon transcriptional regulator/uracil phosphoribosyltransferase PyrR [Pseudomonadales bacterium]